MKIKLLIIPIIFILSLVLIEASVITDTSRNQFWDSGTFFRITTTADNNTLILNDSISGNFTSDIFDVNVSVMWNSLTFDTNLTKAFAQYHLNEVSGAFVSDSSGNSRNGNTVNMEDGDWVSGKLNNALDFDGTNEYVSLGNIANFERTDNFSYEGWFKTNTGGVIALIGKRFIGGTSRGYEIYLDGGVLQLNMVNDGAGANLFQVKGTSVVNNNSFVHFVVTYNGNSSATGSTLYINGIKETPDIIVDTLSAIVINSEPVLLGARTVGSLHFTGQIDEIVIYDRELTQAEVTRRFNNGIGTESEDSNSINFSVRSCNDNLCSGENFININDTSPQNLQSYSINNNRYFQYMAEFLTDDGNFTPQLQEVLIDYTIAPEIEPQALLVKEFFFPNASTSSSNFVTIGTTTINITRLSNIDAIISFQARREGGTGIDDYSWRILVDGESRRNITRTLTPTDIGSVVFSGDRYDISIGTHNVTLQHLATEGTLFTENIDMVVNLHLTENNSRVNHDSGNITTSFNSTSYMEVSTGTMEITEDSMVMLMLTTSTQSSSENTVEFIIEFNNENSSSFKRHMESSTDIGSIGYIWQYNNILTGIRTWKLWGRNSEPIITTITDGHIDIDQMTIDNIPITMSHFTNQTTRIDTASTFIQAANLTIETVRNNSVYVASAFTVNIENQGGVSKNVSYFLQVDGINSQQLSRTLSDVNDIGNLFIHHIFNDSAIIHNVSLFVASELGGGRILVINNVSMYAMEVIDFESVITIPAPDVTPPIITLINPANNTATNIVPLNITFSVTDDSPNATCILQNSTIIFDEITSPTSTTTGLILAEGFIIIDQEFPNLNINCFDNSPANNSAVLNLNYTLDTILPVITPISPSNLSSFNADIISSINIQANCTDVPVFSFNITIRNSSDIIATFQDLTPENNVLSIVDTLDISNLGLGTYDILHICADTHTKNIIGNYNVRKNISSMEIKWVATDGNTFRIKYLQNSLAMNSFGSDKSINNDKYNFYFISNESESKTKRIFIFEIISDKQVYYINPSKYRGHFITRNNWIDFELGDKDATYLASKNENGNWEIEVTTSKTNLNFASVGELNIATLTTQFDVTFKTIIKDDTFSLFTCPLENLQKTLLFMFFIILAFAIMIIGFIWRNGLIGTMGAFLLLTLSAFIYACIIVVGIILTGLAIIFISLFVIKGTRAFN